VWKDNREVYGADKVWLELNRQGIAVARCTIERLMRGLGLQGVRRGKKVRTTTPGTDGHRASDLLRRDFTAPAPNRRWVADFTYVATWAGIVYVSVTWNHPACRHVLRGLFTVASPQANGDGGLRGMAAASAWVKWPVLGRHERAAEWLSIWADLGRAPRTIDAYARGLAEYLEACERSGIDPVAATRAEVAAFVRGLRTRPSRRGGNVVALDSGAGLANATLRQRLVPVRLFYDFLVEEGVRGSNPVGRGRYTPGRRFGGAGGGGAGAGAPDDQVAVDSRRGRMAADPGGLRRRAGPQPGDAGAGL
jgi:hypothetical protein